MLFLGLSGYSYKEWQGDGLFYPPGIKQAKYLEYYATRLNSLEAVGVAYALPSEDSVQKWIAETPDDFVFAPKMHQKVTDFKRLKPECYGEVELFVKRFEPLAKANKLGPILILLPANFKRNDDLLANFLDILPKDLKWAFEFRNDSWNTPEIEQLLKQHKAAWVSTDTDEEDPQVHDIADYSYIRLRRLEYDDQRLQHWATQIEQTLKEGKDCYVYCRHKDTVAPWKWADRIKQILN